MIRLPMSDEQDHVLARVARATDAKSRAEAEWRDAVRAAAAICPNRAVGDAARVSGARVHQLTNGRDANL